MKFYFEIAGARYDMGELNYKYIDDAETYEEALAKYRKTLGYPYRYLRLIIKKEDGPAIPITLHGDKSEEELEPLNMRMGIAQLWMSVTGEHSVDTKADWKRQLEDIHHAF